MSVGSVMNWERRRTGRGERVGWPGRFRGRFRLCRSDRAGTAASASELASDGVQTVAAAAEEQKAATDKIQAHAIDEVSYIPLGEYNFPQARRAVLVDMPPTAVPVFWGVKKTEE